MIVAIVGPTATGKSNLGLDFAQRVSRDPELNARFPGGVEIISADAFQLYRGMDVGTAKTPESQRCGIAHHQIDVLWPDAEASVAAYQKHARSDVEAIETRGALPLVVGGSGLYVRALLDVLEFPPTDPAVRARWEAQAEQLGAAQLHEILQRKDPKAAETIEPLNARRLVRALEVMEITGRPFSATLPRGEYWQPDTHVFYLTRNLDELDERINARSREMFSQGLLEETAQLAADRAHPLGITAQKATGYSQALAVLRGEMTVEDGIAATALATRQLSRRQIKWFRRDKRAAEVNWNHAGLEEQGRSFFAQARSQILGH